MIIHKTHSRMDLIDIINTLDIPIIFSHVDNKKSIHEKFKVLFDSAITFDLEPNVYKIKDKRDLQLYLINQNIKKSLSVKEKSAVMNICKHIINYCVGGYVVENSSYYKDVQTIHDDVLYISQFGDIPSSRRACKLMNANSGNKYKYEPIISPQMIKKLHDKKLTKQKSHHKAYFTKGHFVIKFD